MIHSTFSLRLDEATQQALVACQLVIGQATYSKTIIHLINSDKDTRAMLDDYSILVQELRTRLHTAESALISIDDGLIVARSISINPYFL